MDAQTATKAEQAKVELHGANIIAAIKDARRGIRAVGTRHRHQHRAAAPDRRRSESSGSCASARRTNASASRPACTIRDKRALILIQYTGFLDSLNAIRAVAVEYKQPICMMVGLLGHEPERAPTESGRYGVRIIEPICDAMGIPHHLISQDSDVAKIKPAIDKAYADSFPVAMLIGRRPLAS